MNAGLSPEEQARVVAEATAWLGTPFHKDARLRGVGVDCANLLAAVYEAVGLVPPIAIPPAPHGWHLHSADERYLRGLQRWADRAVAPWEPGDLVVFRGGRWPSAGHGGIYVGDDLIVHAVEGAGVERWPLSRSILQSSLDSVWRLRRV